MIRRVTMPTAALVAATLTLGMNAAFIQDAEAAERPTLQFAKTNKNKYGWDWGSRAHKKKVVYKFRYTGTDVVARVRAHNNNAGQVAVVFNGNVLGYIGAKEGRKSRRNLWWLPASMQNPAGNKLQFRNMSPGAKWGVQDVGVFDVAMGQAAFGSLATISGDQDHADQVRLSLPAGVDPSEIQYSVFDIDSDDEVARVKNAAVVGFASITADRSWGPMQATGVDGSRQNNIDFVHLANKFQNPTPVHTWGVRFARVPAGSGTGTDDGTDDGTDSGTGTGGGTDTGGGNDSGTGTDGGTDNGGDTSSNSPLAGLPGLNRVSHAVWDDTAVRKVLHTFAFGGHATPDQITTWANMDPGKAIKQMLTMAEHNTKLSPLGGNYAGDLTAQSGTLEGMADYFATGPSGIPADKRSAFGKDNWQLERVWTMGTTMRGYNPFRQRMLLWETNYHLAVNYQAGIQGNAIHTYYDLIGNSYASGDRYEKTLAKAAKSAAVARQYKHDSNRWRNNECECNEDFAREFYQLFFGILGTGEMNYHETVSIKNMAKALTDMQVKWFDGPGSDPFVTFGTQYHFPAALEMSHTMVTGVDARDRIDTMADLSIQHPESLNSLPVMVVKGLADDNPSESAKAKLREAWASMADKDMLHFVRNYAVSDLFHSGSRVKHWSSVERAMILSNRMTLSNKEAALNMYGGDQQFRAEDVGIFTPRHNVFGGQTGTEAASSPDIFVRQYNRSTSEFWRYGGATGVRDGVAWKKNWKEAIPADANNAYSVKHVAEYLWQYFMADGLKNFGPLERAQVYSILEGEVSMQFRLDETDQNRVITSQEAATDSSIVNLSQTLGAQLMALGSSDSKDREDANFRVGAAINFIVATPYIFVQEGQ